MCHESEKKSVEKVDKVYSNIFQYHRIFIASSKKSHNCHSSFPPGFQILPISILISTVFVENALSQPTGETVGAQHLDDGADPKCLQVT